MSILPAAGSAAKSVSPIRLEDLAIDKEVERRFAAYAGSIPQNQILVHVTDAYLDGLDLDHLPTPAQIEERLLARVNNQFAIDNGRRAPGNKTALLRRLTPYQIAQCLLRLHHVIRIAPASEDTDREYDLLAMYRDDGPNTGVYATSEEEIRTVARRYNAGLSINDFKEVIAILHEGSRRTTVCQNRDLIAVDNGIFNYADHDIDVVVDDRRLHFPAKTLRPFDPVFVFLAKSHVPMNVHATSPVITNPIDGTAWEVEEWMGSLSDDPEVVHLLWEILGAIIRPHVRWGKSAFFYSEQGNNGKGTLCELMRNLTGPGAYTAIPLSELGEDFALEPLLRVNAIIVDENDVGTFIDKAANFKTIVTNDVMQVNRKYRMPVAYQFWGFMVQCLNEMPRFKDKSESLYRRQLYVPFTKCFTGAERKYIKNDYLHRPDVLQYVLKRVLVDMTFYELSEPQATREVLDEAKEHNDPVRGFWNEMRERFVWDLLPSAFLYELFKAWFAATSPSGSVVGRNRFLSDLRAVLVSDPDWHFASSRKLIRPAQMMSKPELLIDEYDLKKWMNPSYTGPDPARKSRPILAQSYQGVERLPVSTTGAVTAQMDDDRRDTDESEREPES